MIDWTKLPPAPWYVMFSEVGAWTLHHPEGGQIARFFSGKESARFAALARNAEDVMVRRGWGVGFAAHEGPMHGWFLVLPDALFPLIPKLYTLANMRGSHPFAVLLAGDAWYKANVEGAGHGH